jgi:UDP-N-acetyl-2-amino-2-deoxyglucuronate dehydrogenase
MVRLGLVGCGKIGQRHLQALAHVSEARLVATADAERARAEAAAVPFDAQVFDDALSLFRSDAVDAVIIATPSGLHPSLAQAALEQGLDVLVEKPLALSYRDAYQLVEFADHAGLVLAVTHFNRMLPAVARVLDLVRAGYFGTLLSGGVAVRWARPQSYYDEAPWRGTRAMDGGMLFNQAIHALDLAVAAFGPADEVFAYSATKTHAIEAEDEVAGVVRFRSGVLLTVAATTSVPGRNLEERLTLVGTRGVAVLGPEIHRLQVLRGPDADQDAQIMEELAQEAAWPSWRSHWNALNDFIAAVNARHDPQLSAASTLDVLALVEALTRSGIERRPVRIAEVTGTGGTGEEEAPADGSA